MWTTANRARYDRNHLRYRSDLTDEEWALIEPRIPPATSGQKRRLTPQIKRELRRRAAIEPVIGHLKAEHRMGRNYLAHHAGDAVNAVLAAAGYNFHLLLRWLERLLSRFLAAQKAAAALQ